MVGHLFAFVGRASFFFGSAFFSLVYFRHLPERGGLPPLGWGYVNGVAFIAVLFALFCYSLELERLGKALEGLPDGPLE